MEKVGEPYNNSKPHNVKKKTKKNKKKKKKKEKKEKKREVTKRGSVKNEDLTKQKINKKRKLTSDIKDLEAKPTNAIDALFAVSMKKVRIFHRMIQK